MIRKIAKFLRIHPKFLCHSDMHIRKSIFFLRGYPIFDLTQINLLVLGQRGKAHRLGGGFFPLTGAAVC